MNDTDLVLGNWVLRFEPRTMEDLKLAAPSDPEDDRLFATVARLSKINLELYRMLVGPWWCRIRTICSGLKAIAPLTLQYELCPMPILACAQ